MTGQVSSNYIKNRELLKKQLIDEKIRKQVFQREVATPLQKLVVEQATLLEGQKKIDEKQNELINKLQKNQLAIVGQLGINDEDLLQQLVEN